MVVQCGCCTHAEHLFVAAVIYGALNLARR
jgi:hypothetical protein